MTYSDMTAQSPETQAAVEHEVRLLLKVTALTHSLAHSPSPIGRALRFTLFLVVTLQESYDRAKALLKSHTKEHKNLADALLMYETLDAKEIQLVLEGKTLESR